MYVEENARRQARRIIENPLISAITSKRREINILELSKIFKWLRPLIHASILTKAKNI